MEGAGIPRPLRDPVTSRYEGSLPPRTHEPARSQAWDHGPPSGAAPPLLWAGTGLARKSCPCLVELVPYPACMSSTPPSGRSHWVHTILTAMVALALLVALTVWDFKLPPVEERRPDWALGMWEMDEEMARQIHKESWRAIDEENRKALEHIRANPDPVQRQALIQEQEKALASIEPRRSGAPYTYVYFRLEAEGDARLYQGLSIGSAHLSGPWKGDEEGVTIIWRAMPDSMMLPAGRGFHLARQGTQLVDAAGTVYHKRPK